MRLISTICLIESAILVDRYSNWQHVFGIAVGCMALSNVIYFSVREAIRDSKDDCGKDPK